MSGHDRLVRTRAEQGLPPTLEDVAACERIAMLLSSNVPEKNGGRPRNRTAAKDPRRQSRALRRTR